MMASDQTKRSGHIFSIKDRSKPGVVDQIQSTSQHGAIAAQTARSLLDRPLPPGYREEWARHYARTERGVGRQDTASGESKTVMIFRIGEEWLALPIGIFHDVVEPRPIHSLPHRRDAIVLGLVNIRGELLVCVSLRELLHIGQDKSGPHSARTDSIRRLVVIGKEDKRIVFIADEVHGIQRCDESTFVAVPATISKAASALTTSMLIWDGRSVGCLDQATMLDMLDRSLA